MNRLRCGVLLLVCAFARPAIADDARGEKFSNDDLCRAIGETPRVAVQPRDRLFFEKKCACTDGVCGERGSSALSARAAAARRERTLAKAQAAASIVRIAKARTATSREREAFEACRSSQAFEQCAAPTTKALEAACRKHGLRALRITSVTDECYGDIGPL